MTTEGVPAEMSHEQSTRPSVTEGSVGADESPIKKHYQSLHSRCGEILDESLTGVDAQRVAASHDFANEIALWCEVIGSRKEVEILRMAAHEYQFAVLALVQGHYRQAFKSLRLVLELLLQCVYLSANELQLREWLESRTDTVWNILVDSENGVLSVRFARTFFPSVETHVHHYSTMARKVYRECSECVHGNPPKDVPLPKNLEFSRASFDLWHDKAANVALVGHFALALRYLSDLSSGEMQKMETVLSSRLGHISEFRVALGGPRGG
jgi:hypothetical protein